MERSDLIAALQRFMLSDEIAELTGYPATYVATYMARGKLPKPIGKLGRYYVWDRQEIEEWLKQKKSSENAG